MLVSIYPVRTTEPGMKVATITTMSYTWKNKTQYETTEVVPQQADPSLRDGLDTRS